MSPARSLFLRLDSIGIVGAIILLAASLTPSLIPREAVLQGVLSGGSLAVGYLAGVFAHWLWNYLELPTLNPRVSRISFATATGIALVIAAVSIWSWGAWQDSLREQMGMPTPDATRWILGAGAALAVFLVLLMLARVFIIVWRALASRLRKFIPRRISNVTAAILATWVFWVVAQGSVFGWLMRL